ncbi:Synaptic vesicle glycoprotein 2B [Eumeta japonica]|uniref:Synaptic vesicle glycoprotein 2B n=1 Tax=Eumeta variegata TaxID=151549 RepID=A0A4C1TNB8_EUMVA|nr:Synaptic vesicle glycoprotein 2B [Eumeta japonica]
MNDLEGSDGDKTKDRNGVNVMRNLEDAMCLCKFGRFHWRVLAAALAACFANNIVTANTSYLLPAAECDFDMSINQKGLLNAAPFVGMLSVGFFSAFLTDAFGRRRFLVWGYFGIFVSCLLEGSSQTFEMLLLGKFLEGCCLSRSATIPGKQNNNKKRTEELRRGRGLYKFLQIAIVGSGGEKSCERKK